MRRLFINASYHLLGLEVPAKADVKILGDYKPSAYAFHKDEHWQEKGLKVEELD